MLLGTKTLILNKAYMPVQVISVKRAFALLYQGDARAVDEQYRTFDFTEWKEQIPDLNCEAVGTISGKIRVPRVLLLTAFERAPKRHVRFSRVNIYIRDNNTCQYCGRKLPDTQLNLDHIVPRSRGGLSSWENIVCACRACNLKKGGRTPEEARMTLIRKPGRLSWAPFNNREFELRRYESWLPYLTH